MEPETADPAQHLCQGNIVCLPVVSQSQHVVCVSPSQVTQQLGLGHVPELVEAFESFPYLTQQETATLAQRCSLHPDQVRVWFMAQRLHYGISWDCQDIHHVWNQLRGGSRNGGGERVREDRGGDKTGGKRRQKEGRGRAGLGPGEEGETRRKRTNSGRAKARGEREGWDGSGVAAVAKTETVKRKDERKRPKEMVEGVGEDETKTKAGHEVRAEKRKNGVKTEGSAGPEKQASLSIGRDRKTSDDPPLTVTSRTGEEPSLGLLPCPHRHTPSGSVSADVPGSYEKVNSCSPRGGCQAVAEGVPLQDSLQRALPALWNSFCHSGRLCPLELTRLRDETGLSVRDIRAWFSDCHQAAQGSGPVRSPRKDLYKRTKTPMQVKTLREAFLTCQFPSNEDYNLLMVQTGLSRALLVQWFCDMRYYVKNGTPQWLTSEERVSIGAAIRASQRDRALAKAQSMPRRRRRKAGKKAELEGLAGTGEFVGSLGDAN